MSRTMYKEGTANYIMWITLFERWAEVRDREVSVDIYIALIAERINDVKRTYKSALLPFRSVHFPVQLLLILLFILW